MNIQIHSSLTPAHHLLCDACTQYDKQGNVRVSAARKMGRYLAMSPHAKRVLKEVRVLFALSFVCEGVLMCLFVCAHVNKWTPFTHPCQLLVFCLLLRTMRVLTQVEELETVKLQVAAGLEENPRVLESMSCPFTLTLFVIVIQSNIHRWKS